MRVCVVCWCVFLLFGVWEGNALLFGARSCSAQVDWRTSHFRPVLGFARVEEVQASVSSNRPVGMLATAVDPCKGLLMEEDLQAELLRFPVHHFHETDIAVTLARVP